MSWRHGGPGTPEELWRAAAPWTTARTLPLTTEQPGHLVVLAAHPDDETLGAGGLIACAAQHGWQVDVVVATDGEGSHPASRTHTRRDLATVRAAEVRDAVRRLAPRAALHRLRLPDGELAAHRGALAERVRALLSTSGTSTSGTSTWLAAPWRGDQHPDHAAAGQVAADLVTDLAATASASPSRPVVLLEYPVWAWHWAQPDDDRLPWARARVLTLPASVVAAKAEAMGGHRSQVAPLSPTPGDEVLLTPDVLAHFHRDVEVYWISDLDGSSASTPSASLPAGYFDDLYRSDDDPWRFADRWYERRKRALTLAALPRERFRRAVEPGCSVGLLTQELARRCDEVLASDVSARAVDLARRRTAHLPGVRVERGSVPDQWPAGQFDLVVLSELGYYCAATDLAALARVAAGCLAPDGVLVACHWRHPVPDYPVSGDAVHAVLQGQPGLAVLAHHEEADFLLDVLVRAPATSVATAEGLV